MTFLVPCGCFALGFFSLLQAMTWPWKVERGLGVWVAGNGYGAAEESRED